MTCPMKSWSGPDELAIWVSAGMLIKCCILPSRNIKSAKVSGALPRTLLGELTALPRTPQLDLNQFYV